MTLQDRLVKELRLEGISSIDAANALMPSFIEAYNARLPKHRGTSMTRIERCGPMKRWT